MNECIDCGAEMRYGKCLACGWQEPKKTQYTNNKQCAYTNFSDRCPLPGTMTESTKPDKETQFYCYHHQESRDNPKRQAFLYHEIMAGRLKGNVRCDVQVLMENKIADMRESNPELFYVPVSPDDSREYQKMIMAYIRKVSFQKIGLPYDKDRTYAEPSDYNEAELLQGVVVR